MKEQIKKLICAALACACIAPAGAVGVLADDTASAAEGTVINEYTFDGNDWKYNTAKNVDCGVMGGTIEAVAGIGSNETKSAKLTTGSDKVVTFYDLTAGPKTGEETRTWLDVSKQENAYVRVDAKVYVNDDTVEYINLTDNWGGKKSDEWKISANMLEKGKWNDISYVAHFENARYDNEKKYTFFDVTLYSVVNGVVTVEAKKVTIHNQGLLNNVRWNRQENYNSVYLCLQIIGESGATAYIDDVKTTAYSADNFTWGTSIKTLSFEKGLASTDSAGFKFLDDKSWSFGYFVKEGASLTAASAENIGGNTTKVVEVTGSGENRLQVVNSYRPKGSDIGTTTGGGTTEATMDMYDENTKPYQIVSFDVYVDREEDVGFWLTNTWGSATTEKITGLKKEKWNNIAILTQLTKKWYDGEASTPGYFFEVTSDVYVNGRLVSDGATINARNSLWNQGSCNTDNNIDRFNMFLRFGCEKEYKFYIDNIDVVQKYGDMKSEEELLRDPTTIAPKLKSNAVSLVSGSEVSIIADTTASQLTADVAVEITVTREGETIGNDEALEAGDVIELVRVDNSDTYADYTVKEIVTGEMWATGDHRVYCRDGYTTIYSYPNKDAGKTTALEAKTYGFLLEEVYNTTGKDIPALKFIALYDADGTLVKLTSENVTLKSSLAGDFTRAQIEMTLTADDVTVGGRYLMGGLFRLDNLAPTTHRN